METAWTSVVGFIHYDYNRFALHHLSLHYDDNNLPKKYDTLINSPGYGERRCDTQAVCQL